MPPIACTVVGIIAAVLFAIGGGLAWYGAVALACVGFLFAGVSMPDPFRRHKGAWMAGPLVGRPILIDSDLNLSGLSEAEVRAVLAHELGHATVSDRFWRLVGSLAGACTIPTIAGALLVRDIPSNLPLFIGLVLGSLTCGLVQFWSIECSERRADRVAVEALGETAVSDLRSAKLKLSAQANEQRGPLSHERGKSPAQLRDTYLRGLGGTTAVLHQRIAPKQAAIPIQIGGGNWQWLTEEGKFVLGLVDGNRTLADIIVLARAKSPTLNEFATIRLLHQLREAGVIR